MIAHKLNLIETEGWIEEKSDYNLDQIELEYIDTNGKRVE